MQEECLIGFVIYNSNNKFLLTKNIKNGLIDYGIISKNVSGKITNEKLNEILKQNLCLNVSINKKQKSSKFSDNLIFYRFIVKQVLLNISCKISQTIC